MRNKVKTGRKRCTRHNQQDILNKHIGHPDRTPANHPFDQLFSQFNFLDKFKTSLLFFYFHNTLQYRLFFSLSQLLCFRIRENKSLVIELIIQLRSILRSFGTSEVQTRASSPGESFLAAYSEVRKPVTLILQYRL